MTVRLAVFVWRMWRVGSVPLIPSIATFAACNSFEISCVSLGAYLISEHGTDWTDRPDACSHRKACGPFQLVGHWPHKFGYDRDDRLCPWKGAELAALAIRYSIEKTEKEGNPFDWRARLKCSRKSRPTCRAPVRGWHKFERKLSDGIPGFAIP